MAYVVGPKGQVVIDKAIRDHLGVRPGWLALEKLVDDHLEVYFVPPEHRRSLKGSLAKFCSSPPPSEDWEHVREAAWVAAWHEQATEGRP